jgi:S-layer protein (TIGR01567 family)
LPLDRHISKENKIYHIKYGGKENMTKRILTVALAALMLLSLTFVASAQTVVQQVNVRGSVVDAHNANSDMSWNYQNFAGFFYDLKNNISTETMFIDNKNFSDANIAKLNTSRTIPEKALIYTTVPEPIQYKMNEQQNVLVGPSPGSATYDVVGWQAEKWVAVNNVGNKIAKLVLEMQKDDKKTMTTGETWAMGAGYELTINAVDARATPRQVWFTLKKDGAVVDEGIGQGAAGDQASKQNAVYYKTKTILGESNAILFTVYVDSIFSGATSDMVQFKYAWLIDESSAKQISGSDTYGAFEVTQASTQGITMDNKNTVSLSQNSQTTLLGNFHFTIADDTNLRFYPEVTYTDQGTYEVRGSVADAHNPKSPMLWNYQNFAGFFYDIKNNVSTETMFIDQNVSDANIAKLNTSRTIPEKALIYSTNPEPVQYKMNEQQNVLVGPSPGSATYDVVGWQAEKWVAVNNVGNKIAKLVLEMEKDDKKTMTTGETWAMGAGYEMTINAVDARATPRQVWFTLKKDGAVVDEGIGQGAAGDQASKQNAVYYKTKTILGESNAILFTVYVDSIFSGATSDMVQFKYAWLIDESSAKQISGSDTFGAFEVTQASTQGITMDNKNTVSLSQNSQTTLMGNLIFNIADDINLRFYPAVDFVIGTPTPVTNVTGSRTGTYVATPQMTGTTIATAAPTAGTPVVTTAIGQPATPAPTATPKQPGFEAAFAIAGLLAVAFLVLRQRK